MPATGGDGSTPPRTLAEKLEKLRQAMAPKGGKPPSWQNLAHQITDQTGLKISGVYLWELANGKPEVNPKLSHLTALAKFFDRRISYFVDDEVSFEDDTQAQLELLKALKKFGIRDIHLQHPKGKSASRQTVIDLLARLQTLDLFSDPSVRSLVAQVGSLSDDQRQTLCRLAEQPDVLEALQRTSDLVLKMHELDDGHLHGARTALARPDLLAVVHEEDVQSIALQYSSLSAPSREALRSVAARLEALEENQK